MVRAPLTRVTSPSPVNKPISTQSSLKVNTRQCPPVPSHRESTSTKPPGGSDSGRPCPSPWVVTSTPFSSRSGHTKRTGCDRHRSGPRGSGADRPGPRRPTGAVRRRCLLLEGKAEPGARARAEACRDFHGKHPPSWGAQDERRASMSGSANAREYARCPSSISWLVSTTITASSSGRHAAHDM